MLQALQRGLDQLADWAKKWSQDSILKNVRRCILEESERDERLQYAETKWEASDTARNNRRERSRCVGGLHCETNNPHAKLALSHRNNNSSLPLQPYWACT